MEVYCVFVINIKHNNMVILRKMVLMILLLAALVFGAISCTSMESDADLRAKIETALGTNHNVLVKAKDGVVTLSGVVETEDERLVLENLAKAADAKGVKSIVNNIVVKAPVEVNTDDVDLMQKIVDATKDYPTVQATVLNGVITVRGTIEQAKLMILKQSLDDLNAKKVDISALIVE